MKTLSFRSVTRSGKRFLVLLHSKAVPDPEEWNAYLRQVAAALASSPELVHVFVVTDGGGPIAAQRKALADLISSSPVDLLTHVFTRDSFVRGIVTAFRWISRSPAIAYAPEAFFDTCCEYGHNAQEVLDVLDAAQQAFPPVMTLSMVRYAMEAPVKRAAGH